MHVALKRKLGVDWHGTTSDGAFTIEPVYCLGLCACAPAVLVDEEPVGNVTVEGLDDVLAEARA
jgi:formate dehydrogenase subunit gamma